MTGSLDTIVAPATVTGSSSALAIVRLDGPGAFSILEELSGVSLDDRRATLVRLSRDGTLIDEAIATGFRAPRSFTGNDLVEVTTHGSRWVIGRLVEAAIALGARVAERGEFTERAVLNGRLDLTQAEAIGDLIAARAGEQAALALRNLEGSLGDRVRELRAAIVDARSRLEAALDFSEEGYEFIEREELLGVIRSISRSLRDLRSSFERGRATREGLRVAILGRPNAGKSTLLNALLGYERAIVTELPGTTRDLVREDLVIAGHRVIVSDTAGIRESGDQVEKIGIELSRREAADSDLVLYLIPADEEVSPEDERFLATLESPLVIRSKSDLGGEKNGVRVSASSGDGVEELLSLIAERVEGIIGEGRDRPTLVNERQVRMVDGALEALARAELAVEGDAGEEVIAADLQEASRELGRITGEIGDEELLREIFDSFCIGK